jgi:hypothetical protein
MPTTTRKPNRVRTPRLPLLNRPDTLEKRVMLSLFVVMFVAVGALVVTQSYAAVEQFFVELY